MYSDLLVDFLYYHVLSYHIPGVASIIIEVKLILHFPFYHCFIILPHYFPHCIQWYCYKIIIFLILHKLYQGCVLLFQGAILNYAIFTH